MKKLLPIAITLIFLLFSNCEKHSIDDQFDWKYTDFKYLILDSNIVEFNTTAKFTRVSDSILIFYGFNHWYKSDCIYKINFSDNNYRIKTLKPMVYGTPSDIKDISFPDHSTGFLLINDREANTGIDSKLYTTSDGGQLWNEIKVDFRNTFRWIHFITPDSGIAISENYSGTSHYIFTTSDGGNNWLKIVNEYFTDNNSLSDFYFIPQTPKICFISCNDQLLYSTNGGFRWSFHSTHKTDIVSMSFLNENVGFIANSNIFTIGSPIRDVHSIYKIDKIGGSYLHMHKADYDITKIQAISENEVYYNQYLSSVFCTTDGFTTVYKTTIQDPAPDFGGDRIVTDFTISPGLGVLSDVKGTIYLKLK